jgi:hypothetical protein
MSGEKKNSADEIIEKSIELFGLTPEEISDNNVEWMRKKGYKKNQSDSYDGARRSKSRPKNSRLNNILKLFRKQKRD